MNIKDKFKIFDYIQEFIYVIDIQTNEIVYLNNAALQILGCVTNEEVIGKKCYKVLQGYDKPCSFCTNLKLKQSSFIEWEHYNKSLDKTLLLRDMVISINGREYRVELGSDIMNLNVGNETALQNYKAHEAIINKALKIALTPDDIDDGIQQLLGYVGSMSGAERVYIFESLENVVNNTYEWCDIGISHEKENLQNMPSYIFDVWNKIFDLDETIIIKDIEDIKYTDPIMYDTLKPQNINSIIVCKITVDGKYIGFCGFDNPPEQTTQECKMFLNILPQYLGLLLSKRDYINEKSYTEKYDLLTGLYNREFFFKEVNKILKQKPNEPKWMLLINLKDFKLTNNIFGPDFGDHILKSQGMLIEQYISDDTLCGRIFGDKFALLIRKDKYDKNLLLKAFKELEEKMKIYDYKPCHHVVACDITGTNLNAETLYNCLNIGEKDIKNKHELTFIECDYTEIKKKYLKDSEVLAQFDNALSSKDFKLFIQAHVNIKGEVIGGEALVRWEYPKECIISPNSFVPLLEKSGLIYKLDTYMWDMAAKQLSEWKKSGYENWHISVNVSAEDFYNVDIMQTFVELTEKYDINPNNMILEITESTIIENISMFKEIMFKLKEFGFKIAVDDFGKGYSSLNMIAEFPFDIIKFDKDFLDKNSSNCVMNEIVLEKLVDLVKSLGADIVFEGVETQNQFELLKDMEVDIYQGYHFCKPIPVNQFNKKFMKN